MTLRPCTGCGQPSHATRCPDCQAQRAPDPGSTAKGYDYRWQQLSHRARRLQPWCTDCGAVENLTVDHSEEAWARRAAGKVIRLCDVTVLCGPCNSRAGSSRPGTDRAKTTGSGARQGQPRQRVRRAAENSPGPVSPWVVI